MKINRFSASAIHLALSLLVFLSFIAVLYLWWFPGNLFFMDGGWQIVKLVAMIDLVLGPLLTLMLFKRGKPSLKFDMSVIASIQIAALLYGFYTTYNQRVVALVYADQRFNTLTLTEYREASDILTSKGIDPKPLQTFGDKAPVNVFTQPFDRVSYGEYLESVLNDFPEIRERNDQYIRLDQSREELREFRITREILQGNDVLRVVEDLLAKEGLEFQNVELYRLKARYESGLAVLDPASSSVVKVLRHERLGKINPNLPAQTADKETSGKTMQQILEQPAEKTVVSEDMSE